MLQHVVVTSETFLTGMTILIIAAFTAGFFFGFMFGKRKG